MNPTIHQLWYDNMEGIFRRYNALPQTRELVERIDHLRNKLYEGLDDGQRAALEAYENCCDELASLHHEQAFAGGFRLGMQLTMIGSSQD